MSNILAIDHLALYFFNLENARKFFIDGLGLKLEHDYGDEIFLSAGVALFKGNPGGQSVNHLALKVKNFTKIKNQLESLGYHIYKEDMVDGPEGIRIQLVQ